MRSLNDRTPTPIKVQRRRKITSTASMQTEYERSIDLTQQSILEQTTDLKPEQETKRRRSLVGGHKLAAVMNNPKIPKKNEQDRELTIEPKKGRPTTTYQVHAEKDVDRKKSHSVKKTKKTKRNRKHQVWFLHLTDCVAKHSNKKTPS